LLGLQVRIPPGTWMSLSCECCVSLQQADPPFREVIPAVDRVGLFRQRKKKNTHTHYFVVWFLIKNTHSTELIQPLGSLDTNLYSIL
jgi:hypothetical protein